MSDNPAYEDPFSDPGYDALNCLMALTNQRSLKQQRTAAEQRDLDYLEQWVPITRADVTQAYFDAVLRADYTAAETCREQLAKKDFDQIH